MRQFLSTTLFGVAAATSPLATAMPPIPPQAASFSKFSPKVKLSWDDEFLFVGSDGMPSHGMMVGITTWQQQVPIPQSYFGDNAWRVPLHPVPAAEPKAIKGHFLRGAIGIAANGVPIFNPQNNRGEISQEIGELDQWGGHCGRADDYHYHAAPLHLEKVVGAGKPIAFALDGYPIYGLTEPDGGIPKDLDACAGHTSGTLGYHYHASTKYPYVNGGFHGEVVERDGQVDPQPRARPMRPSLPPLRDARITGFEPSADGKIFSLRYSVNGKTGSVNYTGTEDGAWKFQFVDAGSAMREEVYAAGNGGGGEPPRRNKTAPSRGVSDPIEKAVKPETPVQASGEAKGSFVLQSSAVAEGGMLPSEFTGDGAGLTPPLSWSGAPQGTKSYALIMHHVDPEGAIKWYWTIYDIPAGVAGLPKNVKGIGKVGTGFKGQLGYETPHSKGPGPKTYILTLYALSEPANPAVPLEKVSRSVLLEAMKGRILASTELKVVYSTGGGGGGPTPPRRPAPEVGGPVKPTAADTEKVSVYADNWFVLCINGKIVAVDPIDFLPHNVVSLDILPEYPMSIAIMAKDNADPKTGMEYGNHIGNAGFIIKFADGTVSNATWKAKCFFKGPLNRNTTNPKVEHTPIPENWFTVNFNDSQWENATEYTGQRVNPKESFFEADFTGAKFIWTEDLDLDNTVIFRTKIEKPGWKPRWNTKPDLRVTGTPPN